MDYLNRRQLVDLVQAERELYVYSHPASRELFQRSDHLFG
jgi:hypothetical protein